MAGETTPYNDDVDYIWNPLLGQNTITISFRSLKLSQKAIYAIPNLHRKRSHAKNIFVGPTHHYFLLKMFNEYNEIFSHGRKEKRMMK